MSTLEMAPGVIAVPGKYYFGADEVMGYLGCKENKAYQIIRGLRQELIDAGRLYPGLPQGQVPRRYFLERCMIED